MNDISVLYEKILVSKKKCKNNEDKIKYGSPCHHDNKLCKLNSSTFIYIRFLSHLLDKEIYPLPLSSPRQGNISASSLIS